jgi:hypothetical protein
MDNIVKYLRYFPVRINELNIYMNKIFGNIWPQYFSWLDKSSVQNAINVI